MGDADDDKTSAERVRAHIAGLTRAQFQDLTRRLVLYAARLLRGASLDHHAYDIVTGAMDLALEGSRTWDPRSCPFENFLFGVVRSRASILRNSAATRVVKIAAQLPERPQAAGRVMLESVMDDSLRAHPALSVEQEQEIEHLMLSMARISETLAQVFILSIYEEYTVQDNPVTDGVRHGVDEAALRRLGRGMRERGIDAARVNAGAAVAIEYEMVLEPATGEARFAGLISATVAGQDVQFAEYAAGQGLRAKEGL